MFTETVIFKCNTNGANLFEYCRFIMSLGDFIFHRDEFMVQYDCSRYNVNSIPIEERRNIPVGILFISLGILCEVNFNKCLRFLEVFEIKMLFDLITFYR